MQKLIEHAGRDVIFGRLALLSAPDHHPLSVSSNPRLDDR
jgi:hypothetical protein